MTILCCNCSITDWLTSVNPFEIFIGGLVGALIGWLVSVIHARETEKIKSKKLRDKYQPIAGHYVCKLIPNGQTTEKTISKADLYYQADNHLTIELTTIYNFNTNSNFPQDQVQIWTGEITMDSIRNGIIIWEYRQPEYLIGQNGFKRIIIDKDLNGITLVGETAFGYGLEKMKRENKNGG